MDLEQKPYLMRCTCGVVFKLVLVPALAADFAPDPQDPKYLQATCNRCSETKDAANGDVEAQARQTKAAADNRIAWETVCPLEYRTKQEGGETDVDQLRISRLTLPRVGAISAPTVTWTDIIPRKDIQARPVLLLVGDSGAGKTRIAWRVVRAAWDQQWSLPPGQRLPLFHFTSWSFQAHIQDVAGQFQALRNMQFMTGARLLFIDDLGKVEWTDTTAAAFFEVLEQRITNRMETVITTELQGERLENWFRESRSRILAEATNGIMRRLRQFALPVHCAR